MGRYQRNSIIAGALLLIFVNGYVPASSRAEVEIREAKPAAVEDQDRIVSVLKQAMPAAPKGWIIAESRKTSSGYVVVYRRATGIREEQNKLDQVYTESARRNNEAAKPAIDDLIREQQRASVALKKATRRRNVSEQQRLNDELDENGSRLRAIHEDTDRKIADDVAPYLVRDAEATVSVNVNADAAELRRGVRFAKDGAVFALRVEGEQASTVWKEGKTLLLYGEWRQAGEGVFKAALNRSLPGPKAQTIRLSITGEKKRCEQLLKELDLKSILSLM